MDGARLVSGSLSTLIVEPRRRGGPDGIGKRPSPTTASHRADVPGSASARPHECAHWVFVSLSQNGRAVRILYVGGDGWCAQSSGILVKEQDATVTITATGVSRRDATVCPASLKQYAGAITLAAPLGQRGLVHSPVSGRWKDVVPMGYTTRTAKSLGSFSYRMSTDTRCPIASALQPKCACATGSGVARRRSVLGEHASRVEPYGLGLAQLLDAAGGEKVG